MLSTIQKCGNGVNKDLLPSELLPGQWSDALNIRFRNDFAEKFKGIKAAYAVPAVVPYYIDLYTANSSRFIIEASTAKVFCDDGVTATDITRFSEGKQTSSITFATTTGTLTTATAHGLTTGATVIVYLAFPAVYNGTFVITVTSTTAFTYALPSTPTGVATTLGAYSTNVNSDFTGAIDDRWTGGALNGVLILNSPADGLHFWSGTPSDKVRRVPTSTNIADSARMFKNYIVSLGTTVAGVKRPHNVAWSSAAEPGSIPSSFTSTLANDAGNQDLAETTGQMVDSLPLGDVNIIYKQDARYAMQYIGGNFVFRFQRLPGNDGLLARGCVVNTPKGHVFLTNGDVKIHNGGEATSICEGRIRRWLFTNMDTNNAKRSFLALNPQKKEVWVVFPSFGQTDCDTAATWNWDSDTWGIRSLNGVTYATSGLISATLGSDTWNLDPEPWNTDASAWFENEFSQNDARMVISTSTPRIGLVDTGTLDFGVAFSWLLEKRGIQLDDSDSVKTLSASRPQFSALPGTIVSVFHGSAQTTDGTPNYAQPVTYTVGTSNMANRFASGGRYMAYKLTSSDPQPVTIRSYDLDYTKQGRF